MLIVIVHVICLLCAWVLDCKNLNKKEVRLDLVFKLWSNAYFEFIWGMGWTDGQTDVINVLTDADGSNKKL